MGQVKPLPALMLGLLLFPSLLFAAGKCERLIVTGSPDAPPYLWRDPADPKRLIGANADVLKQVAGELGIKVELLYGGKRSQALDEVRSGRMDLLADAPLDVEELEALDYIHPPIMRNEIMVWTRRTQAAPFNLLIDLKGHPGAISEKTRLTRSFEGSAQEHLTLERVPNLAQAFQKLMLGQVEYVLAGHYAGMALSQTLGFANDLMPQPLPLDKPGFYLALSFNSACNDPWLRGQLAKKMTESSASGLSDAAVKRNLDLWKAQLQQAGSSSVLNK